MSAFIARFNPHQMDDETVLALATGRKQALAIALDTLADNREGQGAERQHLLVVGPRGRGKSFFLKYLRIHFERDERFQNSRFISLPEEQSNVRFASDFVRMILSQVTGTGYQSVAAYWREPEELWQKAYAELEDWCKAQLALYSDFLLVVVVENFQDLLERMDESGEHRIRHMMEHLPGFVLIGATPFSRVDSDYNRPLFHIFKELQIERWTSEDYLKYFRRRLQNDDGRARTPAESRLLEAKLLAISQYTGGSPRMAVVLSNLLLHDNVVGTARTLYGLVDELTPYYQDLTKEIPSNSRLLFDALIRLGENLSQSELAAKVGATQNEISKAFRWLHENGYVVGTKRLDSKEFRYYVSDRVFVLYYQQREIFHDKNYTPIWLMADFLMEFFAEEGELKREALVSLIVEPSRDSEDLMRVWMRKRGMDEMQYAQDRTLEQLLKETGVGDKDFVSAAAHLVIEGRYERAIEYSNKLLFEKEVSQHTQMFLNWIIGMGLTGLEKHENAIKHQKNAYKISLEVPNIILQALSLGEIGKNLQELGRFDEAFESLQKSLGLWTQIGDSNRQSWTLERIGKTLENFGRFNESTEIYQKALSFREQEENILNQAWNLERIGSNFEKLGRHAEALDAHQKAFDLQVIEGATIDQAWNLGRIGWNLAELNRYEESIDAHQKAMGIWTNEGNIGEQAWHLQQIGWNLEKLGRYSESIDEGLKALQLYQQNGDPVMQAFSWEQIGWSHKMLRQFPASISAHRKAIELRKKNNESAAAAWNIGQIAVNHFLREHPEQAWAVLKELPEQQERTFKQFGDAVAHKAEWEGPAAGFALANQILHGMAERSTTLDIHRCLNLLFVDLITMNVVSSLLRDVAEEAKLIFPDADHQAICDAAIHCAGYLESGKNPAYLEKISPDMAILVRAIVDEGSNRDV